MFWLGVQDVLKELHGSRIRQIENHVCLEYVKDVQDHRQTSGNVGFASHLFVHQVILSTPGPLNKKNVVITFIYIIMAQ